MSADFDRRTFIKGLSLMPFNRSLSASLLSAKKTTSRQAIAQKETSAKPAPLLVDGHVHVWKNDSRFPWAPETKNPPDRAATAEQLIKLMQANGVSRTVLIQVIHYRWDNRYTASILKQYPQYFQGVARVNPEDPASPDHLSQLTERDGFHGVRLSPSGDGSGDWIRGALMPPLWQRCQELNVPMTILTPITRMPDIRRLAEQFPNLTIVIDHMADCPLGQPKQLEALLELQRFPRLYVKISHAWSLSAQPYPYRDAQAQIHRIYDTFGPRRLIAGTDWPLVEKYCSYAQAIDLARNQFDFLNEEDKRWICGQTALEVWPTPQPMRASG